jgi:hypothetical protein
VLHSYYCCILLATDCISRTQFYKDNNTSTLTDLRLRERSGVSVCFSSRCGLALYGTHGCKQKLISAECISEAFRTPAASLVAADNGLHYFSQPKCTQTLSLSRNPIECPKPGCLNRLSNYVTHLGTQSQNYGKGGEPHGTLQRQRAPRQTSLLLSLNQGSLQGSPRSGVPSPRLLTH